MKDLGKRLSDDRFQTKLLNRLRCMFSARTTAKVCIRNQNFSTSMLRRIQWMIQRLAIGIKPHVIKKRRTKLVKSDALQKSGGNNPVGIDIVTFDIDAFAINFTDTISSH